MPMQERWHVNRRRATPCVHHWVLGDARRGVIKGVCRRCGAHRTYPAGLDFTEPLPDLEPTQADLPEPVAIAPTAEEGAHVLV
jgi:hypothetical protein